MGTSVTHMSIPSWSSAGFNQGNILPSPAAHETTHKPVPRNFIIRTICRRYVWIVNFPHESTNQSLFLILSSMTLATEDYVTLLWMFSRLGTSLTVSSDKGLRLHSYRMDHNYFVTGCPASWSLHNHSKLYKSTS